jgi:tetratricopeptide (TPR) repeat protein
MSGKIIPFKWREHRLSPEQGWAMAERVLAMPISERVGKVAEIRLDDSELLLAVCEVLRPRLEISPTSTRTEAEFFYAFLDKPKRKIGLFDEREYYLGEFALTAGTACRVLFHREEARRWFDRAEASFTRAANGLAHVARVAYQRLALAIEERRLNEVLELAPLWVESFESMGLAEEALKCRFLVGLALRETGEVDRAVSVFLDICRQAEDQRNVRLVAQATNTLAQFYRVLGNLDEAMVYAKKALPLLKQLDNRVGLVKLRWGVGSILREQGKVGEAVAAYREALEEARAVGMRGDVAALHLVMADVMLDAGQDRQAEWEVRAALPIIDEEQMVPEGFAALSLLRNALRYQQVDRKALRELHGYFGDSKA